MTLPFSWLFQKPAQADTANKNGKDEDLLSSVNRELYKRNAELAYRNKTLALLRKLDEASIASVGIEDMSQKVTTAICQELGYELVAISILNNKDEEKVMRWLSIASQVPEILEILKKKPLTNDKFAVQNDGVAKKVLLENKVKTIEGYKDAYPDAFSKQLAKLDSGKALKSSLIYPLTLGHNALGVLILTASRDLNNLSRFEEETISGVIGLISLAIYKAKIYEDLQKTTEDLREANESLAQVDKAKSEFLSIASHQLYTPLTAIKGYLSMVQEGDYGKLTEEQSEVIDIVTQSSDRLIGLIKDLLDVSRIESGRLEMSLESVDLIQMAKDFVVELAPNAKKKNLQLKFIDTKLKTGHVVADRQRIRQVLLNTIDNSIKYTNEGHIDIKVVSEDDSLVFSVQDTGKGVTAEEIGRLFTKFTRVGGAEKFHTNGSGLGLYVAKKIVTEHHGDIWVESPGMGKGSTFFVRLPVEGSKNSMPVGTTITIGIKAE
jgi:signal transduction histidine kinase